ncbi:MAG TPA: hypothetical protein VGB77_08635 [Abditibacteriaceae bacterium]|jgi:hypothetical protein
MLTNGQLNEFPKAPSRSGGLADTVFILIAVFVEALEKRPYVRRTPWLKKIIRAVFDPFNQIFFLFGAFLIGGFAFVIYKLVSDPQATVLDWASIIFLLLCVVGMFFTRHGEMFHKLLVATCVTSVLLRLYKYFSTHAWYEPLPEILSFGSAGLLIWLTGMAIDRLKVSKLHKFWQVAAFMLLMFALLFCLLLSSSVIHVVSERII